jgi:hypothetical protein
MSTVNNLLLNADVRRVVWKHFQFSDQVVFPIFSSVLLYGLISELIHFPVVNKVILSDHSDEVDVIFYKTLAQRQRKPFELFDEMAASSYDEKEL